MFFNSSDMSLIACRHLAAAREVDDRQVESVFLEDAELVADVDRNDRVRVRRRLADRERCSSGRRPPSDDRSIRWRSLMRQATVRDTQF